QKIDKKILKLFDQKSILVLNKVDIKTSKKFSDNKIYEPIKISVKKNIGISKLIDEISKKIADHFKVNEDNIISRQHINFIQNQYRFLIK
ncbi:MAG: tRNA uridine-5-carboxymethylaminomethyl(34) synthesis GTPase MnmE, partial [Proteobacteria bacterium]|nr:tRNA uridine-5-carboxymethylaminomethyl(34) synthesis GTPase MnmE [Pseudomonadota bacterium]